MSEQLSTWDEIRRLADELELKMHLASMDARDRWQELAPRLTALENTLVRAGERATEAIEHELSSMATALRKLRDDTAPPKP